MFLRLLAAALLAWPLFGQVAGDPLLAPLAETDLTDFGCTAKSGTTPEFDAAVANCWEMTLSASVTASTLVNEFPGRTLIWKLTQDSTGGRTFVWPTEVSGACTIASGADAVTVVAAIVDGSGVRVTSCGVVGGPDALTFACTAASNVPTPASGQSTLFCDSAANNLASKDDGGTVTSLEQSGGSGDSIEVEDGDNAGTFTVIDTTARFDDSGDLNFTFADGGAGGPDVVTATVRADSVALTTDTTGNYAAGDAEAGAALTGDSATAFFSAGTIEQARLPTEWDVRPLSIALDNPVTGDAGTVQWEAHTAVTITMVDCSTDTGTATIQFDERTLTTPNTAGTDVMTSTLVCDNNNQQTTAFTNATIASGALLNLDVDAVASSPTKLRIHVRYTID